MEENNKKNPTNTNVIGEIVSEMVESTKAENIEETPEVETVVPDLINNEDVEVHGRYNDVYYDIKPQGIYSGERSDNNFFFKNNHDVALKVEVHADTLFRFRYTHNGIFENDFSYAIQEDYKIKNTAVSFVETDDYFSLKTSILECRIDKKSLAVIMLDDKGETICEDADGYAARTTIMTGLSSVSISKKSPKKECYFGLGDKSCSMNMRGHKLENWCTDAFAYGQDTDPLYRAIPFYYGLNNGNGYGIFFDNSHRTTFDFDSTEEGITSFEANGGEVNYYFIYGPALLDVTKQYMELTGQPEMPPIWALGFHQCRWSYYPEARVRELAAEFRERQIPCDAIYLDIDYMDGYRCFTVNEKHFPDMKGMIADLKKDGFSTVVMIDPGIKKDESYSVYKDGVSKNVFCKRTDGSTMIGPVWPDQCVFPDFTNPVARAWWEDLYEGLYGDDDVAGFWNDMNEPAVFKVNRKTFPDEVQHHYDGQGGNHKKAHNVYGLQMTKATQNGLKKIKPNHRPFVLTRASYSGGQRYAAVWTGDNIASWEQLQLANLQCQRLSMSGFSFVGTDVGGFVDSPSGELMVRWLQLAAFHPLYRVHSMGSNTDGSSEVSEDEVLRKETEDRQDQEPWAFGEPYTAQGKEAIEFRYQLLPYLYTAFYQSIQTGRPVLYSLAFLDQNDTKHLDNEREFMFGDHLLVSPVIEEGATSQEVYLPKGNWFHYQSAALLKGETAHTIDAPLDEIPVFVKAGAVLPHYPIRQSTKEKVESLSLHIYYDPAHTSTVSELYEDAGDGYEYQKENYQLLKFNSKSETSQIRIDVSREGRFKASHQQKHLYFYGLPFEANTCVVDGIEKSLISEKRGASTIFKITLDQGFRSLIVK